MRTARVNVPGVVYHVISRFVDRDWFLTDDDERRCFLHLLGRALTTSDWRCLAYALMSNHIHLAMVAGYDALSSWAKPTNAAFAQWLNRRRSRLGPIYADRPRDFGVLPENEGRLIAYIHNNPVRAGVVSRAAESTWTSHAYYLARTHPAWLDVDGGLMRAGFDDREEFDRWVAGTPGAAGEVDVEGARRAIRRRGRLIVGTPTRSEPAMIPIMGRPFGHVRFDPKQLTRLVTEIVGISETEMCSGRRSPRALLARRTAVHCGRALGITTSDLAAVLGLSVQGVCFITNHKLNKEELAACQLLHKRFELELAARTLAPSPALE